MKPPVTVALFGLLLLPGVASASWFEFCDLQGSIERAELIPSNRARLYQLDVRVSSADRARVDGDQSYVDCHGHLGQTLTIRLQLPRKIRRPSLGDQIFFSRSAVDGIGPDGFERTHVQVRFLKYVKAEPSRPEG
jgi:hypothetical protein